MPNKYFKAHEAYNLNPHRYDIGTIIGLKNGYEDNLFIKKLFTLPEPEYPAFYQYHLVYFLGKEPDGEEEFFTFTWQIVLRRINFIEHKNPFNSSHALDMEILEKLTTFQKYLRSIDQWHTQKTLPEIIADQHEVIRKQQSEIAKLKNDLSTAKKLETKQYIDIPKGHQAMSCINFRSHIFQIGIQSFNMFLCANNFSGFCIPLLRLTVPAC